jgi:hypothetical protein
LQIGEVPQRWLIVFSLIRVRGLEQQLLDVGFAKAHANQTCRAGLGALAQQLGE